LQWTKIIIFHQYIL